MGDLLGVVVYFGKVVGFGGGFLVKFWLWFLVWLCLRRNFMVIMFS